VHQTNRHRTAESLTSGLKANGVESGSVEEYGGGEADARCIQGLVKVKSVRSEQGTKGVAQAPATANPAKRVLLVEDDPDQREVLAIALGEVAEVIGAGNGSEAMTIASRTAFDVCVLDLTLPDVSGYELVARLSELQRERRPVMIALTGYGRPEDAARVKAAGFQHHVVKPADLAELMRLIRQAEHQT
jgi:CheY-like chemotaxis protein